MRQFIQRVLIVFLVLTSATHAMAAAVGTAVDVDPSASSILEQVQGPMLVGTDIFIGQKVVTGDVGQVEIQFADDTRMVVGPHSSLVIQDYLLRDNGGAGQFAVSALGGTFRFITGNAAKDRYKLTTPTGTIGVRGTEFDLAVDAQGKTTMLLYSGAAKLCAVSGKCTEIADQCAIGEISDGSSEAKGYTGDLTKDQRKALKQQFLYSASQVSLTKGSKIKNATFCLKTGGTLADALEGPLPTSLSHATAAPSGTPNVGQPNTNQPDTGGPGTPGPVGGPDAPTPPTVKPPTPPPHTPEPPSNGGDGCAGHSHQNGGNSQNCNGK